MRNKTMTIHEFMQECRIKEFNKKRNNKIKKELLFLIALLAILIALNYSMIDLSNNTATAFLWSELQC